MLLLNILQFFWIAIVIVYMAFNMLHLVRLRPSPVSPDSAPMISVCIPARNEERDIEKCLMSLLRQNYPNFEIIAVNDHSTDKTGEILHRLAGEQENTRLAVIDIDELPEGWLGKPHALHTASKAAHGDYLLFTDADPVFEPNALSSAMALMKEKDLDLLTLMPGCEFGSFWERCVQPVIFGFIGTLSRFRKINDQENNSSAMGFGAFLMFKRSAYEKISGHEGVKNAVLEDVFLAKNSKKAGLKMLVAEGRAIFSIRMYHSLYEIWVGWRKNMFLAMRSSIPRTLYYIFAVLGFCLTPYIVFLLNIFHGESLVWTSVSLAGLSMVIASGMTLCHHLRLVKFNLFLFPLGAVIMGGIMLNSMIQITWKQQTEWRGRTYRTNDSR
jgi:chlorobactene glucosyltransferase